MAQIYGAMDPPNTGYMQGLRPPTSDEEEPTIITVEHRTPHLAQTLLAEAWEALTML